MEKIAIELSGEEATRVCGAYGKEHALMEPGVPIKPPKGKENDEVVNEEDLPHTPAKPRAATLDEVKKYLIVEMRRVVMKQEKRAAEAKVDQHTFDPR